MNDYEIIRDTLGLLEGRDRSKLSPRMITLSAKLIRLASQLLSEANDIEVSG